MRPQISRPPVELGKHKVLWTQNPERQRGEDSVTDPVHPSRAGKLNKSFIVLWKDRFSNIYEELLEGLLLVRPATLFLHPLSFVTMATGKLLTHLWLQSSSFPEPWRTFVHHHLTLTPQRFPSRSRIRTEPKCLITAVRILPAGPFIILLSWPYWSQQSHEMWTLT